ncbi:MULTISPECIES: DUF6086 family protein [Streptomyces]|uniref:DUF6086 family protein n=1 Tax=Streptomyces TaxID=1883 RepID=UPI001590CE24|nr:MULTISPECIES: DUF6086 family protein [Streptomyces]QKV69815.1 hypothetical protein HUT13_14280 [Streptomyces harbinensis]
MSCYFLSQGKDLWNPSNSVARIFVDQAIMLAKEMGLDSGIEGIIEDECEIHGDRFTAFLHALLLRHGKSNNQALRSLLEGVTAIGLVITERAGWDMPIADTGDNSFWDEKKTQLARSMPTG